MVDHRYHCHFDRCCKQSSMPVATLLQEFDRKQFLRQGRSTILTATHFSYSTHCGIPVEEQIYPLHCWYLIVSFATVKQVLAPAIWHMPPSWLDSRHHDLGTVSSPILLPSLCAFRYTMYLATDYTSKPCLPVSLVVAIFLASEAPKSSSSELMRL